MKTFKAIRSKPASAIYNMELDIKIFNRYLKDGIPVFRVYGWDEPSFTYGVSQAPGKEIDIARCVSDGIGIAGRMTGGGILFHDNEITYSFVCAKSDVGEPQGTLVSYRDICAFLIKFYESLGLMASFAVKSPAFTNKCASNEFCQAAYEKYDIIINGKKIGGNAQKRSRQAIFQHGSIPISIDWNVMRRYVKSFPDIMPSGVTTLSDELATVPSKKSLEQNLIDAFSDMLDMKPIEEDELSHEAVMA